ncbi:MAG: hypothetical protein AAF664_12635 [Planctomycetota bacterium]
MNVKIFQIATIAVIGWVGLASASLAGDGKLGLLDQTGCCDRLPACNQCCELEAKVVDEDKPCFDVESKVICIPRVVFPWQKKDYLANKGCDQCDALECSSCNHNGARARKICVLKKDKITCPTCEYKWTPKMIGGCDFPYCDSFE